MKEHRKRSGSVAKCDDPRVALGPAVLSESAALLQAETKQKVSRQGVQSLWEPWRSASRRDGRSRGGRRTARAAEGKACRQFLAPFGDLDVPKGFAKNGDTIVKASERVVYAKRPFAGPAAVLAYLSRYTHRIAISSQRLVAFDERA